MADFNSGLPVRTEANGDVAVKVVDGTLTSQSLSIDSAGRVTVKHQDGAGNAITSQISGAQRALDVGINVAGDQIDPRLIRSLTSTDTVTVASITAALPAGTNLLGAVNLSLAGTPVSETHPIPVSIAAAPTGTVINNFNTSADLAAQASSNHTYTITTGMTFQGKKIHASASGKLKIEVQTSSNGTAFNTVFVAFNSTANPNIDIDMEQILFLQQAAAGAAVRIVRTNLDKQSHDVYSTISGVEVM